MEKRAQLDLENLVWVTCREECGRSTGRARGDSDGTTGESCSVVLSCTCVRACTFTCLLCLCTKPTCVFALKAGNQNPFTLFYVKVWQVQEATHLQHQTCPCLEESIAWEDQEATSLSLHNEKIEARDGQRATGLKQLVGEPLDFWLYLVQIGRAMRSQRARPGFHPANMLRCSTVSLPFLNYFKKEPGPEAGGAGRAGVRFWEPASPFVDPQIPSRSLSLTPEGD